MSKIEIINKEEVMDEVMEVVAEQHELPVKAGFNFGKVAFVILGVSALAALGVKAYKVHKEKKQVREAMENQTPEPVGQSIDFEAEESDE